MLLRVFRPFPLCFSCQCIRRYCLVSWFSPAPPTFLQAHLPFTYAVSSFCRSALRTVGLVRLACSALAGATVETLSLTPRPNISLFSRGLFSTHHLPCSFGIVSALLFPVSHILAAPPHTCFILCSALGLSLLSHICLSPVVTTFFSGTQSPTCRDTTSRILDSELCWPPHEVESGAFRMMLDQSPYEGSIASIINAC